MNNEIILAKASLSDIDDLIELRKYILSEGEGHYVAKSPAEDEQWQSAYRLWLVANISDNDKILIIGARLLSGDHLIGCCIGIIDERAPMKGCLNGRMGWMQTLAIHPSLRRSGVATKIMLHILEWFKSNEVGKVAVTTRPTSKLLTQKLGFVETHEDYLIKEFD